MQEHLDTITHNWPLLGGALLVIGGWFEIKWQNRQQGKDLKDLSKKHDDDCKEIKERIEKAEKKIDDMNPVWSEIRERLAAIEATLKMLIKE